MPIHRWPTGVDDWSSAAGEKEQRRSVIAVNVHPAQRGEISRSELLGRHLQISAPSERRLPESDDEKVCSDASVPAVTVYKRMDLNKPMMKTDSNGILVETLCLNPHRGIADQTLDCSCYMRWIDADICFEPPVLTGPFPHAIEHRAMQTAKIEIIKDVANRGAPSDKGDRDVLLLRSEEFTLRRDVRRDESISIDFGNLCVTVTERD